MGEDHSPTFRYSERRRSAFARVTPTGWLAIAVVGAVVVLGGAVLASGLLAGGGSDWGISLFAPPTATLTATATATQTPIATQTPLPPTPTRVPPTATPAVTATPLPTATPTLAVSSISGLVSVGKATVTTEWFNANLRAGPGSEYEVLYHLPPGTVVDVFARSEDWLLVQSGKAYGWVWSGLVEMDKNLDFDAIPEWVFEAEET
ncbi:MAG: SH3 domain-containing protein, partial [Anaerolineae bacterium]|nr:SH3 domain-containing protein [Anaerolineae bacterium]